ncbi:DUF2798 domain-containing protein [Xanthomonas theicola]
MFAFYMAAIMAVLMCLVITAANAGLGGDYLQRVLGAYRLAMPTALCCILVVRLVASTVHAPWQVPFGGRACTKLIMKGAWRWRACR